MTKKIDIKCDILYLGDIMNRKKKIKVLAKLMNEKSLIKIPLIPPIIKCFDILLANEQLSFLLSLKEQKYSYQQLKDLYHKEDFDTFIYPLLHYGFIWCLHEQYELAPIFPGWIEVCISGPLDDKKRQVIDEFRHFEEFLKMVNLPGIRHYLNYHNIKSLNKEPARMSTLPANRKIQLHKKIETQQEIIQHKDVYSLLEQHPHDIAVMNCMCRLMKQIDHHECQYHMPLKACLTIGSFASQIVKYQIGEKISLDEAKQIVDECSKKGAIHTIYHYGMNTNNEEICICNCCKDCCFLYGSVQEGAVSNIRVKAHYISKIKNDVQCIQCHQCMHYCPCDAIQVDKHVIIDERRCIGCGQCEKRCPKDVFEMIYHPRNIFVETKGGKK